MPRQVAIKGGYLLPPTRGGCWRFLELLGAGKRWLRVRHLEVGHATPKEGRKLWFWWPRCG